MRLFASLRAKLLSSMLLVVIVSITILSVSMVHKQSEMAYRQASNELLSLSAMVATNTTAAILFNDSDAARQTLEGLAKMPDIHSAVVFDDSGSVFAQYQQLGKVTPSIDMRQLARQLEEGGAAILRDAQGLYAYEPMLSEGEIVGLVFLANDMKSLTERMQEFFQVVFATSFFAFAASIAIILWLQGLISQPLRQMIAVIHQISSRRDYGQRAPSSAIAEFDSLSKSFNAMVSEVDARGKKLESINLELEQRVRDRTQELESALRLANEGNRAKSEFLAVMSHEVRTPLNGIIGLLELLKIKPLEGEVRKLVDSLHEASRTLLELLNEILDFSKLDANKIEIERYDFDLTGLVSSVLENYKPLASHKGLALNVEMAPQVGHYQGDAKRLRQILSNFLSNAIKFTHNGEVRVRVEIRDVGSESAATFNISDTGIGIPQEKLEEIFSPFIQGDSSITRRYGGTGLGLAISRQLINLMHGSYGVSSEPGKGSCFWFTVPLAKMTFRETARPKAAASQCRPLPSGNILVAEDNKLNQEVIFNLLQSLGQHCELAESGAQALAKASDRRFDLILMDYHMPDMDGIEATRLIRQQASPGINRHTPIIALTADIQPEAGKRFRRAGANALLVKPFTLADLQDCLKHWLARRDDDDVGLQNQASLSEEACVHNRVLPLLKSETLKDLEHLSAQTGSALVEKIARIFLEQLPVFLEKLRAAMEEDDNRKVFMAAHALKSSASTIGAERLCAIAREMEDLTRDERVARDVLRDFLVRLEYCAAETMHALQPAMEELRS